MKTGIMSNVLLIRHMPRSLTLQEKTDLLLHYGAEKVWEISPHRDVVLASFSSQVVAKTALFRLHQLEIGNRRLVVEYSNKYCPIRKTENCEETSEAVQNMKNFIKNLNAMNPSVNFFQPFPPNLRYNYPDPTSTILINMMYALATHKPFYTQALHLMNKMSLDPPFEHNNDALNYFNRIFKSENETETNKVENKVSESESEISSGDEYITEKLILPKISKRKHSLPHTKKRVAAILSTASVPFPPKKKIIDQKEIFEEINLHEPKKISVNVSKDILIKQHQIQDVEVVGEIKKIMKNSKEEKKVEQYETPFTGANKTITRKDIVKNKISSQDMKILPVFKNYHPGDPSMRLYLKNLAKNVTENDVKNLYSCYIEHLSSLDQQGFDVRVMQEGRMKGQGFVTFPSVEIAKVALHETNGYLLNDRAIVVQFARAANKNTVS